MRRRVQLLRHVLRSGHDGALRGISSRIRREALDGRGQIAERGLQRALRARRAIDILQLRQDVGDLVGVSASGGLGAQLILDIGVERTGDAGDLDAGTEAADTLFDLIDALADIAWRTGVGDVGGDDRKRGLVRSQAGHRNREG